MVPPTKAIPYLEAISSKDHPKFKFLVGSITFKPIALRPSVNALDASNTNSSITSSTPSATEALANSDFCKPGIIELVNRPVTLERNFFFPTSVTTSSFTSDSDSFKAFATPHAGLLIESSSSHPPLNIALLK